jgi:hypothetical protein
LAAILALALSHLTAVGCGDDDDASPDAAMAASEPPHPIGDAGRDSGLVSVEPDAAARGECTVDLDCALIPPERDCCTCEAGKETRRAVPVGDPRIAEAHRCLQVADCSACPPVRAPLDPILRAACVAHRCAVIDVRELDATSCDFDADCTLRSESCCSNCGVLPEGVPWRKLVNDPWTPSCADVLCTQGCPQLSYSWVPRLFCANDMHCAVEWRRSDGADAGGDSGAD